MSPPNPILHHPRESASIRGHSSSPSVSVCLCLWPRYPASQLENALSTHPRKTMIISPFSKRLISISRPYLDLQRSCRINPLITLSKKHDNLIKSPIFPRKTAFSRDEFYELNRFYEFYDPHHLVTQSPCHLATSPSHHPPPSAILPFSTHPTPRSPHARHDDD